MSSSSSPATPLNHEASPSNHRCCCRRGEHAHHSHHGPLDREKALGVASLSFEPIFNEKYQKERGEKGEADGFGFACLQRLLPVVIGLLTAGAAVVVGYISELLGDLRTEKVNALIVSHGWRTAWLAEFGMMTVLALAAGFLVYGGNTTNTKTAGSSGIPQLIGLLNGCDLKHDFSWRHGLVKWFGVCLAVASGLAVGPEGPMIFIGASIGFFCSRLPQNPRVWEWCGAPPPTVGDDVYTRDYTSIGAACGIAAAFRAPIAGTLFIVEEASSHFKKEQMANIFYGGLAALEVMLLAGGAGSVLEYKVQVGPGCSDTPYWTLIFCIVVGISCGVLGAAFNALNIKVMVWRSDYCNASMPMRRAFELVLLCALSSTAWLGSASLFGEREATSSVLVQQSSGCIKDDLKNQLILGSAVEYDPASDGLAQRLIPAPCLYGLQVGPVCQEVHQRAATEWYAKSCIQAVNTSAMRTKDNFKDYCCSFTDLAALEKGIFQVPGNASCAINLGKAAPSLTEGETNSFNAVGLLSLVPFKTACQTLFERGMPNAVTLEAMGVFLVLFFILAALTAGSAVPSGLLMPQMVIGGLLGRMLALLSAKIHPGGVQGVLWAKSYQVLFDEGLLPGGTVLFGTSGFLDPGIGALIGAAAFLGGSGRVTLFTTIMMVEITGDPVMIFPVGFATIFAVLTGNFINHGLYHSLIDVQSIPYLEDTWQPHELPPGIIRVRDMRPKEKVQVVSVSQGRKGVEQALEGNPFTGFPLVKESADGEHSVVIGMSDRQELEELLKSDKEITEKDLTDCSNMYPVTVRDDFPLQSAYQLFKSMDMKNLVVVDDNHQPLAVMTRFAFLSWRIESRIPDERKTELRREDEQRRLNRSNSRHRSRSSTRSLAQIDPEHEEGRA